MERLNGEQAREVQAADPSAGLDAIAAQAADIELGALPAGERPPTADQVVATTAAELLAVLTMARMMVAPGFEWFDRFEATWSDAALAKIADSGAAVLELHGITMGGLFEKYGAYIALAGATLPPAVVTYQAIKLRQIEAKAPREAPHERAQQAAH